MPFSDTSRDIHLEGNTVLVARCKKIDGTECQSHLDLNKHIGNKEGVFDLDGKNFNGSARRVRLEGKSLCADLKSSNGHWYRDSINLDALVENHDGRLAINDGVDQNAIRPPGWKPWANPAETPRAKNKNAPTPTFQCKLCEDWPYTYVWKHSPSRPKLSASSLKSWKRRKDCPTCILADKIVNDLIPRLARPKQVNTESIVLELNAQPQSFPRFKVKFETTDGEHRERECMMHTKDDDVNLSERYANVPRAQLLSGSSTCAASVSLAKGWIESCVENHQKCSTAKTSSLPARILDVGKNSGDAVRLKTTNGEHETYACLSHCWGLTKSLTLTQENRDVLHQSVDWASLPKVYTDAITFCRSLGIRYLWIDALCIIQDSVDDWKQESSKMFSYYGECYVCIAATSSADHDGGCSVHDLTLKHEGEGLDGLQYCVYVRPEVPHIMHSKVFAHGKYFPLLTRAWVYQERRLSPRVLHVTDMELYFECSATTCCECGGSDRNYTVQSWTKAQEAFYATHKDISQVEDGPTKVEYEWRSIVHAYSQLNLTKQSDRLPALSGLAKSSLRRKEAHKPNVGRYLAGCWEGSLIDDMAWGIGPPMNRLERHGSGSFSLPSLIPDSHTFAKLPKPEGYVAPSWSWACVVDQVKYGPYAYPNHLCQIEQAHVDLTTQDPHGQVKDGWLILQAKLIPSRWTWQKAFGGGYASLLDIGSTRRFWGLKKDKGMKWWRDWVDGDYHRLDPKEGLYLMPLAARKLLGRTESAEFNFKLNPGMTVMETVYLVLRKIDDRTEPVVYERVGWASRSGRKGDAEFEEARQVRLKLI